MENEWKLIAEAPGHAWEFNAPFQLGRTLDIGDGPEVALVSEIGVEDGDIILVASDGVFDNLYQETILDIINKTTKKGVLDRPEKTAELIAEASFRMGPDIFFFSPFSYNAFHAGLAYYGGKVDDITIIVAQVHLKS